MTQSSPLARRTRHAPVVPASRSIRGAILFTGLTRDRTFLIENGEGLEVDPRNFRFNGRRCFLLSNLEAIGPAVRIGGSEAGGPVVMPPIKAKDFNFTSLSDAV